MGIKDLRIGFCITGSFCTLSKVLPQIKTLVDSGAVVTPIFSNSVYETDTRFGEAIEFRKHVEDITGNKVLNSIVGVEPIGPKKLMDVVVIAPCTGNTLSKLCMGITDTSVLMAAKAHLRNQRPVVVAVATNDALGNNGKTIGMLLNAKNIYFVPFRQDNPEKKVNSVVADMDLIMNTIEFSIKGKQIQPVLL